MTKIYEIYSILAEIKQLESNREFCKKQIQRYYEESHNLGNHSKLFLAELKQDLLSIDEEIEQLMMKEV